MWNEAVAEHGDRALALRIDEGDRAALGLTGAPGGLAADAAPAQVLERAPAGLVVAERGQERARAGELAQLHRRDAAAAGGLLEDLGGMDDLARRRDVRHAKELDPLDVPDHRDPDGCRPAHCGVLGARRTQYAFAPASLHCLAFARQASLRRIRAARALRRAPVFRCSAPVLTARSIREVSARCS